MVSYLRLMILGSRLQTLQEWKPTAHGHNFWLDIISAVAPKVDQVVIASIQGKPYQNDRPAIVVTELPFEIRHERLEPNPYLKTALFIGAYAWVDKIVRKFDIDVMHLIDNYGPIQIALSRVKVKKTIFQAHYDPRYRMYDQFLRMSLRPFDTVIAGSNQLADRFRELCLAPRSVEAIPLAVSLDSLDGEVVDERRTRAHLGIKSDSKIILWSGFISTVVGEPEFIFSLRVAKQLIDKISGIEFVFAFKKEHFRKDYKKFEEVGIRIIPIPSRTEFLELARISELLFSPCLNDRAIVCPPLTWLECMAYGVPIVTTNVRGVDEIIHDRQNGIIMLDPNKASELLYQLVRNQAKETLIVEARETVRKRFEISDAASAYLRIWSSLASEGTSTG